MRVSATTVISATPEQVWAFITRPENGPRWQEAALSTTLTTAGPVALGSRMEHVGKWLRMRVPTTAVVTVFDPPVAYGYDITSKLSRHPSLMRYSIEPIPGATRLTLSNQAELARWMQPFQGLLQRNVQGMFDRDVRRLKVAVESEAASTGRVRDRVNVGGDAST